MASIRGIWPRIKTTCSDDFLYAPVVAPTNFALLPLAMERLQPKTPSSIFQDWRTHRTPPVVPADSAVPQVMELRHAPAGTWETTPTNTNTSASRRDPHRSRPLFADSIVEDAFCPGCSWLVAEVGGALGFGEEAETARRKRGDFFPPWATTAMELTGVVFAWTGIEW